MPQWEHGWCRRVRRHVPRRHPARAPRHCQWGSVLAARSRTCGPAVQQPASAGRHRRSRPAPCGWTHALDSGCGGVMNTCSTKQRPRSAHCVSWQRETARICCWAPVPSTDISWQSGPHSKPAAVAWAGQMTGWMDTHRQTDAQWFPRPCSK